MEKIMLYDLIFLVVFCVGVFLFLYTRKKNLTREGWMYLYKTKLGIDSIDKFSTKFPKTLKALKYPILGLGFVLMGSIIYLLLQTVYTYIKFPQISSIIKAPPVMPLIPYFPQIFKAESFMPPFYFSYFIIALLIVAIVHEFSHGIFMRLYKVKIKSTGFAFLGPILGAFVEQDDKDFQKKKNSEQMTVLGAGVFANILFALIFFGILVLFFNLSYSPSGYKFSGYAYNAVNVSGVNNYTEMENGWISFSTDDGKFLYTGNATLFIDNLNGDKNIVLAYYDAPAIKNNLSGAIMEIDGVKITNPEDVSFYLDTKKPSDIISVKTINSEGETMNYDLELAEHPTDNSKGFLGITHSVPQAKNILSELVLKITMFKNPSIYYSANYNQQSAQYFYDLFWWIAMINLFVGLFNMLPLGILDGGRFFYLTILSITKNKKVAEKSFKYITIFIILIFLAMMVAWLFSLMKI